MDEEWEQDSNAAVEEVLNRYPEAREFLPLLTAGTVQEFEEVAREVATRVRNIKGKETKKTPSPRTPKPDKDRAVTVKEAVDARDWSSFLAAAWVRQNEEGPDRG